MPLRYMECIERIRKIFPNATEEFIENMCKKLATDIRVGAEELDRIKEYYVSLVKDGFKEYKFTYPLSNGRSVDVIIALVPENAQVKETRTGNYKVGVLWPGGKISPWVSAFFDSSIEHIANDLVSYAGEFVLLVGKFKERVGSESSRSPYTMNVYAFIPLETTETGKSGMPIPPDAEMGDMSSQEEYENANEKTGDVEDEEYEKYQQLHGDMV